MLVVENCHKSWQCKIGTKTQLGLSCPIATASFCVIFSQILQKLHNNATLIDLIISTPDEEALALKACGDKLFKFQLYFESQIFQKRRQQYIQGCEFYFGKLMETTTTNQQAKKNNYVSVSVVLRVLQIVHIHQVGELR